MFPFYLFLLLTSASHLVTSSTIRQPSLGDLSDQIYTNRLGKELNPKHSAIRAFRDVLTRATNSPSIEELQMAFILRAALNNAETSNSHSLKNYLEESLLPTVRPDGLRAHPEDAQHTPRRIHHQVPALEIPSEDNSSDLVVLALPLESDDHPLAVQESLSGEVEISRQSTENEASKSRLNLDQGSPDPGSSSSSGGVMVMVPHGDQRLVDQPEPESSSEETVPLSLRMAIHEKALKRGVKRTFRKKRVQRIRSVLSRLFLGKDGRVDPSKLKSSVKRVSAFVAKPFQAGKLFKRADPSNFETRLADLSEVQKAIQILMPYGSLDLPAGVTSLCSGDKQCSPHQSDTSELTANHARRSSGQQRNLAKKLEDLPPLYLIGGAMGR